MKKVIKDKEPFIITGDFNAHSDAWCLCGCHNRNGIGILSALDKNDDISLVTPLGLETRRNPMTGVYFTIDLAFSAVAIINQLNIGLTPEPTLTSDHEPVIIENKRIYT